MILSSLEPICNPVLDLIVELERLFRRQNKPARVLCGCANGLFTSRSAKTSLTRATYSYIGVPFCFV